ncbi:hypothetical protein E3N88_42315 [Mikania micrantha]|uniref:Uncharacterized protein n=1 Tax=Mikania micrantha TaxID=192012 RepID=A0A5N6LI98_9ASTR|nr:hypothetical protein E3N88_42315 [Mikania micrantha]
MTTHAKVATFKSTQKLNPHIAIAPLICSITKVPLHLYTRDPYDILLYVDDILTASNFGFLKALISRLSQSRFTTETSNETNWLTQLFGLKHPMQPLCLKLDVSCIKQLLAVSDTLHGDWWIEAPSCSKASRPYKTPMFEVRCGLWASSNS